ncbi:MULTISPECIES: L,D-transpeptidase family protein [Sphingomonas]|uniref:L,D-transpeptidase family protein n=1 Tax=Sphingomonas TaxID=13687 RepID=UPI000DEEFFD0|nr:MULTISPECIES: L,D-transpeptidase family protein [Sphingomonas]
MRRLILPLLVLAVVGGGLLLWFNRPSSEPAAVAVARPLPAAPTDNARIVLDAAQQRQAQAVGGFEQAPHSLLKVDHALEYGDFLWNEAGVPAGPVTIRVDLRTQLISVFRQGHEIGTAVVLYGADAKETPLGRFPILWKGKDHRSSTYDAPMPYTLRLTGDGVAIHGSDVRWGAATHGCIGVPTAFAEKVYAQAKVGDPVTIVRSAKPA